MDDAFAQNWTVTKPAVRTRGGIVCAQNRKAAAVGAAVLEAGGNAVDAAIATSFALGTVEPWMSGLGGGGCMLVWAADATVPVAFDFGMVAPTGLDPADYPLTGGMSRELFDWPAVLEDRNLRGPLSICVPTLLAGIGLAHERFGTMPWAELVEPAVELARQGLEIDWFAALTIGNAARDLARHSWTASVWLPEGHPPPIPHLGEPDFLPLGGLADTLAAVAAEGPGIFYRGELGRALTSDLVAIGGRLAMEDLEAYTAQSRAPVEIGYRDARLFAMPGLFGGPTFARCLELLSERDLGPTAGPVAYLAYAEALDKAYEERLATMGAGDRLPSCTSHFCVVDRHGTTVALTQTLLSLFGSRILSPSTGLLLNNGIMWFDPRPGRPNSMAPGKRPLSNMCPVVGQVRKRAGDGAKFALGASGGRRILPAVLQLASFLVDHGQTLEAAFHQPRIDCSGGDLVVVNPALPHEAKRELAARFRSREARPTVSPNLFACPTGVLRDLATGENEGAAEPIHPWAGPVAELGAT